MAEPAQYRISWIDHLPYPLRDAVGRWRSMVGMMLGVGIALGIGMTLLGVSNASVDAFTIDYKRSGVDLYVVTAGGKLVAILPGDTPGVIDQARHTLAQIRALPDVNEALGVITWSLERDQGGVRRRDEVTELVASVGVDGDPQLIQNAIVLDSGRWLRRTNEVVLGPRLAREKKLGLGDSLRLNGRDFTVAGIGKLRGAGFSSDSVAFLDLQSLQQRAELGDVVNVIMVDTTRMERVRAEIREIEPFAVHDTSDLIKQAEEANATGVVIRWIMIGLTLIIAGLFVSNMLARSVSERRLEFATLRAIGISSRLILLTIAAQATLISIAAWFVGLLISASFGGMINATVAPQYGIESLYAADARLFLLVFAMSATLGLVSGLVPARQATRIDPVLVLREA